MLSFVKLCVFCPTSLYTIKPPVFIPVQGFLLLRFKTYLKHIVEVNKNIQNSTFPPMISHIRVLTITCELPQTRISRLLHVRVPYFLIYDSFMALESRLGFSRPSTTKYAYTPCRRSYNERCRRVNLIVEQFHPERYQRFYKACHGVCFRPYLLSESLIP